ncbi:hypothetical protein ATSB10_02800 [Dyella thiooxydans]|uniref:Diguanylate cyclase n=1 Tax=Dyella thiooxydans TaxID=445710 RepID=A0A160MXM0_9GAMM|nr:EAL domain-containing protein [Dyella thiooxydans]AND67734.1 hypothetical protein ATSB10_02800 [Dyella thiooxydans]
MNGSFHLALALLAPLVGATTTYQALDVMPRLAASRERWQRTAWYVVGVWMIGIGLWSQHFVGTLARVPQLRDGLDPLLCIASGLLALLAAYVVLAMTDVVMLTRTRMIAGGMLLAGCVLPMHLLMVASLHLPAVRVGAGQHLWLWCVVVVVIGAAVLKLLHAFRARHNRSLRRRIPVALGNALILGATLHLAMRMSGERFPAGNAGDAAAVVWVGSMIGVIALVSMGSAIGLSEWVTRLYQRTRSLAGSLDDLHDRLRYLSTHDALTGLPNRATLVDRLERALDGARDGRGYVAVLYIDLDGFKHINESLGQTAGDQVLCAVAERLATHLRYESVGRVGGDEFVAVLERMRSQDSAHRIVERLLDAMQLPLVVGGITLCATPSIGVAHFPQDGDSAEALIAHADVAMSAAKQAGRNGYSIYDTSMRRRAERALAIQRGLHAAIEDGSLSLHYQSKHDSATGAIVGAEALARWTHPELGEVPPMEFIAVAERSGQIGRIGEWVIREACRQIGAWRGQGMAPLRIAINLSPLQLNQSGFVDTAARIAAEAGVDPALILFEVTESIAMENAERTRLMLRDFRERGFEFAIDDFGTGYSSLAYLQKFQVRQLKIDRFFVQALDEGGPEARAIIAAIIDLAHTLAIEVVAEGVETQLQASVLRTLGCDQLQGYHFSRPLPPEEFERHCRTLMVLALV